MTKRELLDNVDFQSAPDDALIEIPNAQYGMDGDEREQVFVSEVRYWEFKNQINLW
jgi:hypothetical protein